MPQLRKKWRFSEEYSYWAKDPSIGLRTIHAKAETTASKPWPAGALSMRSLSIAAIVRKLSCTPNDSSFKLEPGFDRVLSGLKLISLLKLAWLTPPITRSLWGTRPTHTETIARTNTDSHVSKFVRDVGIGVEQNIFPMRTTRA
jgi:hypothetical protein